MKEIKVGLVAEGPSDLAALRVLLSEDFKDKKIENVVLSFEDLQPYIDNTSKSGYTEGGWLMVYKWCLEHSPEVRQNTFFGGGLFADGMDAFDVDGILVHMDSDICGEIRDKTNVSNPPSESSSPATRGQFIRDVIANWLWPDDVVDDIRYLICPAVESIEAWLVAGLGDDENPEAMKDIQQRLAQLDYIVVRGKQPPPTIKAPNKKPDNYKNISIAASLKVGRISQKCTHFKKITDQLAALVNDAVLV